MAISILDNVANGISNILSSSDFISRTIGMNNSYEDIMMVVQSLGREPVSLLGKDYLYIFDHVRRNYMMGTEVMDGNHNDCAKFTFYKEKPTVRFANPYDDPMNLLKRWEPEVDFQNTSYDDVLFSYAESDDNKVNNKEIGTKYDIDSANPGVNFGGIASFGNTLGTCDMVKKTNDNFNYGKYRTLIARFHTNSVDTKVLDDIKQTAVSQQYGMSKGRNLLRRFSPNHADNGYDNPYCRVWTYHHQYNQLERAIRPFDLQSAEMLETTERVGDYNTVGFRTVENKEYDFKGGSARLDKYGVLNYKNGMVNIAPTAKIEDYFGGKTDDKITIKKCMFSIENLAWKTENNNMSEFDPYGLSPEQKGPLGGRIMWFPPYDLSFNEDVSVNWNQNQFIGRGEKVYTYTDTERRGSLSFTMLIDHPSILDYWTGHERNGMKNQGVSLDVGNTGGVDNVNNQENTLLRFFAGCEILSAKPQEYWHKVPKPEKTDDPQPTKDNPPETEVHKQVSHKKIYCFAFYPNNYSGMDDAPNKSGKEVNAIHYLLNGIGTQRFFNSTTKRGENFAVDMHNKITIKKDGTSDLSGYGGYETREFGVSIATKKLNSKASIDKTYEGATQYVQFLTDEGGSKYLAYYGSEKDQYLSKYSWDGALSQKNALNKNGTINKNWYDYRYYYRVDSNTLPQNLHDSVTSNKDYTSYIDAKSYKLNSKGIYDETETLSKQFDIKWEEEDAQVISLLDMYLALEEDDVDSSVFSDFANKGRVSKLKRIIEDTETYKITKITFHGNASSQGWNKSQKVNNFRNSSLAKQRGQTFKKWLLGNKFPNIESADVKENNSSQKGGNKSDVNDKITKIWRSAYVVIEYDETAIEHASVAESAKVDKEKKDEGTNIPSPKTEKISVENGKISNKVYSIISNFLLNTEEGKKAIANYKDTVMYNPDFSFKYKSDIWKNTFQDNNELAGKNYISVKPPINRIYSNDDKTLDNERISGVVERYDNEGEFFQLLEKKDPFMHHLITDKIKYFDPAFHSISPEGFNARLTFLHQCTRQGSTVGGSDSMLNKTAYNLAFGRPPVCVLRLGDFYYTKIIIQNISIQYEQPTWDLNPEGIGVMPMFAKVNMTFVFLGGSDLAGPISRLQNAVSFNYYANTSVYDNRAEMVQYDENGSGREVKFKPYSYPDMIGTDGVPKKEYQKTIEVGEGENKVTARYERDSNGENSVVDDTVTQIPPNANQVTKPQLKTDKTPQGVSIIGLYSNLNPKI